MATMKTRFSRKLLMAFGAMLVITLSLAWYFYDSVQWFEYDVGRISMANSVLNGHKDLSAQTEQKIRLIKESVSMGKIQNVLQWEENINSIQSTIKGIRGTYDDEYYLRYAEPTTIKQEVLGEMEGMVNTIILSGEVVRQALQDENIESASLESERLLSEGTIELFNQLMAETLAANIKEVDDADFEGRSLSGYISRALPLFMLVLAALTGLVVWLFSRSLTRSVNVLHHGAKAFTSGDLSHHIPELQEKEFDRLGEAFNTMAHELSVHRTSMEAMVEERTRALKSSNEILGLVDENRRKLLADISHEFRTPLTVIRGEAEIAMRGKAKTKAEYMETLGRIVEQADQTTRLVDDLLFMARADAGEPRLKVRPVSVSTLLDPVCVDFAVKAEQKEISIKQSIGDENAVVMGDAGRLRQVFAILIDNALRYSEQGGTITVGLERGENEVVITVSDNGIGLTREEARQAFQRFFRGGEAQSQARGTGLGLPVAKAIIEAHKGTISLEGESGKGAVATVVLPAEDKLKAVA